MAIAEAYAVAAHGRGKSLSRIATIVVNRGSFFVALGRGQTCSVRNFDKMLCYFEEAANWPDGKIAPKAALLLRQLGRTQDLTS